VRGYNNSAHCAETTPHQIQASKTLYTVAVTHANLPNKVDSRRGRSQRGQRSVDVTSHLLTFSVSNTKALMPNDPEADIIERRKSQASSTAHEDHRASLFSPRKHRHIALPSKLLLLETSSRSSAHCLGRCSTINKLGTSIMDIFSQNFTFKHSRPSNL
jgi:hypothetical protein